MDNLLNLDINKNDERVIITLPKSIDPSLISLLHDSIEREIDSYSKRIIIDLHNIDTLLSTLITLIIHCWKYANSKNKKLTITNVSKKCYNQLTLVKLTELISIEEIMEVPENKIK